MMCVTPYPAETHEVRAKRAFVLVVTYIGGEQQLKARILRIPGVVRTELVYGPYDLIVEVECGSFSDVREVVRQIRKLDLVRSTITLLVLD